MSTDDGVIRGRALATALASLLVVPAAPAASQDAAARRAPARDSVVVVSTDAGLLKLAFPAPDVVHVLLVIDSFEVRPAPSLVVLPRKGAVKVATHETPDSLILTTEKAVVRVDRHTGALGFEDANGTTLLRSAAPPEDALVAYEDSAQPSRPAWSVRQTFRLTSDEGIYGLGQYQDGVLDWRGEHVLMAQANTMATIPFLVSTRGWGVLWDNYSRTTFDDDSTGATFRSEVGDGIDYYVIIGRTPAEAIAGYRRLTGQAPLYPRWAFGYFQSKERYDSRKEVEAVAAEYRRRHLPIDAIVQDWAYWGTALESFSGMVWDPVRYPDPAGMIRGLHQREHIHLMASIWGALGSRTAIFRDMKARGFLYPHPFWAGDGRVYDTYNAAARDLYWSYAKKGLFDVGLDAWWMDATEPEFTSTDDRHLTELALKSNGRNALGSFARYLTPYSLVHAGSVYDHQRATSSAKRVVILTRSAFAGQQRYATTLWPGDIWSSWGVFRNQVAGGLNTSAAGFPYWNTDIGAFISAPRFPAGVADSAFRELHVRWFQFGALSPMFRTHGTNTPREIWRFGEPGTWAYDALAAADRLRYRLLPYVYSLAWEVTDRGGSFLRALPLEFPGDPAIRRVGTEFMFGPALLVNPVTQPMRYAPAHDEEWIPMRQLVDSAGRPLRLDFFRGLSLDTLVATRPTEIFNLTWKGSLPAEVADRPYSARWTGTVRTEEGGVYDLVLNADAGVRLWLDDALLVDAWDNQRALDRRVCVPLAAGSAHTIRIEYRQPTPNTAHVVLGWVTPSRRTQPLAPNGLWTTVLPSATVWHDFWTGERLEARRGAQRVERPAPIDRIPLWVRAGSILPLGPDLQYTDEKPADPIELRVYPGADGATLLYEDEGDSYRSEQGVYATIPLSWDDAAGVLTIGERKGSFPGMLRARTFHIVWVRPGHGGGIDPAPADAVVRYDGRALRVRR